MFLNYCRSRINRIKQQKLALAIPYSRLLQRTSVDTPNLAALGLPFVICLSTIFVYNSYVRHEEVQQQKFPKIEYRHGLGKRRRSRKGWNRMPFYHRITGSLFPVQ